MRTKKEEKEKREKGKRENKERKTHMYNNPVGYGNAYNSVFIFQTL